MSDLFIIMTDEEALVVTGPTSPFSALSPVPLANGKWVLPVSVLDDSNHSSVHHILEDYEVGEVDPDDWIVDVADE